MQATVDTFFYSYYLNDDFLRERGANPQKPRPARLYHWELNLDGDGTLIPVQDSFADGMIYALTESDLTSLYGYNDISTFLPQTVIVKSLLNSQEIEVRCYIAEPDTNRQPPKKEHVCLLIKAMQRLGLSTHDVDKIYSHTQNLPS